MQGVARALWVGVSRTLGKTSSTDQWQGVDRHRPCWGQRPSCREAGCCHRRGHTGRREERGGERCHAPWAGQRWP